MIKFVVCFSSIFLILLQGDDPCQTLYALDFNILCYAHKYTIKLPHTFNLVKVSTHPLSLSLSLSLSPIKTICILLNGTLVIFQKKKKKSTIIKPYLEIKRYSSTVTDNCQKNNSTFECKQPHKACSIYIIFYYW